MSLAYLPEHAEDALFALTLAEREAAHLAYTRATLFAQDIDLTWVRDMAVDQARAEKIDAFVGRFGRLQDHIGEKLLPRFAKLLGEPTRSLLDVLTYGERMGWLENAETFLGARKLRNRLVHEYMTDPSLFLEALLTADEAAQMLADIVERVRREAMRLGLT